MSSKGILALERITETIFSNSSNYIIQHVGLEGKEKL